MCFRISSLQPCIFLNLKIEVFIMGKYKNFTIQLNNIIDSKLAIGTSKQDSKIAYRQRCEEQNIKWNVAKSDYIHSYKTADAYRQTVREFCSWIKENKLDVWSSKDLSKIDKDVCYSYLQENCTAATITKDMSALNKVLDLGLSKKEGDLKELSYKDTIRSRQPSSEDKKYNPENHKDQIEFAQAFGLRRQSIYEGQYAAKDVSLFKENDRVYCSIICKNGKYGEAPCLKKFQESIEEKYNITERQSTTKTESEEKYGIRCEKFTEQDKENFKSLYHSSNNKLFDNYTKKIDNHAFRAQYAKNLYSELCQCKEERGEVVKSDYRGFDKEIIAIVSHALNHERLRVVIEHYLR